MRLHCSIMRGGTSKGILLRRDELPNDQDQRDRLILRVFGSPDRRQIDGLGGADPLTSKLAIVGRPTRPDADIDYTFGQVLIDRPHVDYAGYCGNILSAVAAYAVNEGFVDAVGEIATVRVHVTNTGRLVTAQVPIEGSAAAENGELAIAGVPGTGARIRLNFSDTAGSVTGHLLPSGNPLDSIELPGLGAVDVSVVDMGNPMIFIAADAFGVRAGEGPDELDGRADLIERVETVRTTLARRYGILVGDGVVSDHIPLLALVAPPANYIAYASGERITAECIDFISCEFFLQRVHKAYGIGETVCTAAAALIEGTLVQRIAGDAPRHLSRVRFGHPSGVLEVEARLGRTDHGPCPTEIIVERTARKLMDGFVYVPDTRTADTCGAEQRAAQADNLG